jgi:hypothetical protein
MFYRPIRTVALMVSVFREPELHLGVQASDVMETFYKALQRSQSLTLNDLFTFGGTSYGDLKLTIITFRGGGRIEITPGALFVHLSNVSRENYTEVAKEHLQDCENTLRNALKGVEIRERLMRASVWAACEGGSSAVEAFLGEKGNAALKLDQGAYAMWKKDFTFQFSGLDTSRAARLGLILEPSKTDGDLYVQFEYTQIGSPTVAQTVKQQFEHAEKELETLMLHVGLEPKKENA